MNEAFAIPGVPDASMSYVDQLPDWLDDAVSLSPFWQARSGELLLQVPHVASFRVLNGDRVEVAPLSGVDESAIDVYLRGSVRAALLQQRGEIALHAACLLPPGGAGAVAICGASTTGKSTLGAELCRRGWKLLADDLTRVQYLGQAAMAWPGDTCLRLWQHSCDLLGIATDGLPPVRRGIERYCVPMPSHEEPAALSIVLELRYRGTGVERVLSAADRIVLVNRHAFRRKQIAALGMQVEHGRAVMGLAAGCTAGLLHGSRTESVQTLADQVEEALSWNQR
jgi:hypothetical protein